MTSILFFITLVLVLTTSVGVFAAEEPEKAQTIQIDPNATQPSGPPPLVASPFAATAFVFPKSAEKRFTIGDKIDLLVGFTNTGEQALNLSHITVSLMYPADWRVYVQNYTRLALNHTLVDPATQHSFLYQFLPDQYLEPREFGLTVKIFYSDLEGANYTSVVYNSTIHLVESDSTIDFQMVFTYIGLAAVSGLLGFFILKFINKNTKQKRSRVEYGTQRQDVVDNEWLEGTNVRLKTPKSPKSPTKNRKS